MSEGILSNTGPTCPYCGYEITPDENHYYDEIRYTSDDCGDCGKSFKVEVNIETTWITDKF